MIGVLQTIGAFTRFLLQIFSLLQVFLHHVPAVILIFALDNEYLEFLPRRLIFSGKPGMEKGVTQEVSGYEFF